MPSNALKLGQEAQDALLSKEQAAMQPAVDKFSQTADSPKPEAPATQKVPEAPKQGDFGSDAQNWTTSMAVLSAVTGAFSRQHATTAMKAFSEGIKGYQEGNKEAYEAAHKQWKDSSDAAIANNKILTDKYKEILEDRKLTEQEQMDKLKLIATQYHDPLMANAKDLALAAKIFESETRAAYSAQRAVDALQIWKDKQDYTREEKAKPSIDQETANFAADQLLAGDKSGLSNYGRGDKATANLTLIHDTVQKRASERGITGDQLARLNAEFAGLTSEQRALGTQSAKLGTAGREADNLGKLLIDASNKVDRSNIPAFNEVLLAGEKHTGDPQVVAYGAALNSFINAYARAINPNGVGTVSDKEHARDMLEKGFSKGQVDSVVAQLQKETSAAREAPEFMKDKLSKPRGQPEETRVKVSDPQGKPHTIDPSELDEALQHGWSKR